MKTYSRLFGLFMVVSAFSLILLPVPAQAIHFAHGKDTVVYRPFRDTVRMTRAQLFDKSATESLLVYKPRPFEFITNVPSDLGQFGKAIVAKKNLPSLGLVLGTTALLVAFDQQLLDAAQQFGRYIHLDPERKFKQAIAFKIGKTNVPVLDLPQNLNSVFYFIGEGWPSVLLAGGFFGYGMFSNDYRARQTATQLSEMFFTLAIACQTLKRVSGRQSPFNATSPGGEWHPFTNLSTYQQHVSNYDAMPSGHLATLMATVTILAGNYPESRYIRPVGYSIMGLLGYAMMNNGVHWAGDYPVAIAIGYTCGKIALRHGQQVIKKKTRETGYQSSLLPRFFSQGGYGLCYRLTF